MALLTQECLESLKQKVDLVELLSSYVSLKKTGAYYRALCPFHEENSPSFIIQPSSAHYHCFGCGAHGDAISFLMNHQRLSFQESVELLAERYSVPLVYTEDKQEGSNKGDQIQLLQKAHSFFQDCLINSAEGKEALEYLSKRGIDLAFVQKFELGLAPKDGSLFLKAMQDEKMEDLIEVGLASEKKRAFFFDRITFPIRDARGRVIAFSARLFRPSTLGGKYINTKETPLFKKSHTLFGLNYSRQRLAKSKKVLLVEGQIDALRLISIGLNATVAPLGTALTEQHVQKLVQLGVESAYLAFDSDEAGINAAIKSGNLLQKKGISTFVVLMPENMDPDSLIREKGSEAFQKLLQEKVDYLTFLYQISSKRTDLSNPANKSRVVERITSEIKNWEHPIMVFESLKKIAELFHVPEDTLGIQKPAKSPSFPKRISLKNEEGIDPQFFAEADCLTWILKSDFSENHFLKRAEKNLKLEHFTHPLCKEVYQSLLALYQQNQTIDTLSLLASLKSEKAGELVTKLIERKVYEEKANERFKDSLQKLLDHFWMKERESIKVQIQSGTLSDQEAINLAKKFDEIQKNRPQVVE